MLDLSLVLLGAIFIMLGWYWGGITESRTTAVAIGFPAVILGGVAIFADDPPLAVWAFAGLAAVFGALIALSVFWEVPGDRAIGLYALFLLVVSGLVAGALINDAGELTIQSLGVMVVGVVLAFIFIAAALIPAIQPFRNFVGWLVLVGGAVVAFLGFAESLEITI